MNLRLDWQGLLGVTFPGCAETFHSTSGEGRHQQEQEEQGRSRRDQHQKIRRIRKGDVVALPPIVAHWCFNDGREELIEVSITDINHVYYLAGGPPREGRHSQQGQETFQNVLRGFNEELMAKAFNAPVEIPDEREEREYEREPRSNGLEETWCTMRLHQNIDDHKEADAYSSGAVQLNIVNQHKLPILRFMDMRAEKALYMPHWLINSHSIVYVTWGEAHVQIVDHSGQNIMNDRVRQGNMFVVPQYYATSMKAGRDDIEWLTFRTTGSPMRSPVAGYTGFQSNAPSSHHQLIPNRPEPSPRP
ncbi:11S globulin seed storage protein 2-like [Actinidia eriantha]|uniref:11S globulin seed storage protein 2-like n=1 Tax=Actinidia eriantha TaxID=165200 RepID=UPI00258C2E02|nr:11S globulin seed storage protein 2-like [Actinidia eriantha]